MTSRAQSEVIGVVLLTAVVVVTVSAAGAIVLADSSGDETAKVDLSVNVAEEGVALSHNGGDSVAFADLRVVVSHGNETWRPTVNASGIVRGDDDDQFERGERWAWRQSLDISEVATVRVFDAATETLLAEDRRYPTDESSLTPTPTPEPDTGAPTVTLSSPDGGETLLGGSTTTIAWTANDAESGVSRVEISYSTDGGTSWNTVTADTANDGIYRWTVPTVDTTNALVRVTAVDAGVNTANDSSDSSFSIDSTPPDVTVDAPNGGETFDSGETVTVEWTANDDIAGVDSVDIDYSTNGGASWSAVTEGTANDGSFAWTIPDIDTTDARVRITATDALGQFATDESDANFTIEGNASDTPPNVTVEAPNGGEVFRGGSTTTIEWNASDAESSVERIDIEYSTNSGGNWNTIVNDTADDGSYTWDVPSVDTTNALVRVTATDTDGLTANDTSDAAFTIDSTPPSISQFAVTNPTGYQATVTFETDEPLGQIDVALTRNGNQVTTLTESDFSESGSGPYTYSADYVVSQKGDYTATLNTAADEAGNAGTTGQSDTVSIRGSSSGIPVIQNFSGLTASSDGDFVEIGNITVEEFTQGNNVGIDSVTIEVREAGSSIVLGSTTIQGDKKTNRISENDVQVDAAIDQGTAYNVTVVATSTNGKRTSQSEIVTGESSLGGSGDPMFAGTAIHDLSVSEDRFRVDYNVTNRSQFQEVRVQFENQNNGGVVERTNAAPRGSVEFTLGYDGNNEYNITIQIIDDSGTVVKERIVSDTADGKSPAGNDNLSRPGSPDLIKRAVIDRTDTSQDNVRFDAQYRTEDWASGSEIEVIFENLDDVQASRVNSSVEANGSVGYGPIGGAGNDDYAIRYVVYDADGVLVDSEVVTDTADGDDPATNDDLSGSNSPELTNTSLIDRTDTNQNNVRYTVEYETTNWAAGSRVEVFFENLDNPSASKENESTQATGSVGYSQTYGANHDYRIRVRLYDPEGVLVDSVVINDTADGIGTSTGGGLPQGAVAYADTDGSGTYDSGETVYSASDLDNLDASVDLVIARNVSRNGYNVRADSITVQSGVTIEIQSYGSTTLDARNGVLRVAGALDTTAASGQATTLQGISVNVSGSDLRTAGSLQVTATAGSVNADGAVLDVSAGGNAALTLTTGSSLSLRGTRLVGDGDSTLQGERPSDKDPVYVEGAVFESGTGSAKQFDVNPGDRRGNGNQPPKSVEGTPQKGTVV